jgi:hypothetical protein
MAASAILGHATTHEKGFWESLIDLSFREAVTQKYAKLLYGLHLVLGLIAAVAIVATSFQGGLAQGLLALLLSAVGLFFWVVYVRVAFEFFQAVFATAENIARISSQQ